MADSRNTKAESAPIFIACDVNPNGGEGRLASLFINRWLAETIESSHVSTVLAARPGDVVSPTLPKNSRLLRWLSAYCWLFTQLILLRARPLKNVVVLNYLPLWNVLFFLLVPKDALLGPITGGGRVNLRHLACRSDRRIIIMVARNIVIPWLYWISFQIIKMRGLTIKPATFGVARVVKMSSVQPRIAEADPSPVMFAKTAVRQAKAVTDVVVYTGAHELKNRTLTVEVINRLAERGLRVSLVGELDDGHELHQRVAHYHGVTQKRVLEIIGQSRVALSLSLVEGGFFTYEVAAMGSRVFCLPNSGGAKLPGAVELLSEDERIDAKLISKRCLAAFVTTDNETAVDRQSRSDAVRKMNEDAARYFFAR